MKKLILLTVLASNTIGFSQDTLKTTSTNSSQIKNSTITYLDNRVPSCFDQTNQQTNSLADPNTPKNATTNCNHTCTKNEPLYVVDGVLLEKIPTNLNSENVESIQVLNDTTSPVINPERNNGVVIITTKKPKEKKKGLLNVLLLGLNVLLKQ